MEGALFSLTCVFIFIPASPANGGTNLSSELWFRRSQLFSLNKIYFASGNFLLCFLNDLFLLLLFSLSLLPGKVSNTPPIGTLPSLSFGLTTPIWNPCSLISENNCVSLGTMQKSALPVQEVFLASLCFDHSITQVSLGFGQSPFNNTLVLLLICNYFRGGVLILSWGCLLICDRTSC